MKAIMYHYVREFRVDLPNFRYLDFKSFKNQLDFFEENFGFVDKEEWINFLKKAEMPKIKGKVILTFDDGLRDHYDFVFHELKKRKLWGIFYINSLPYTKNEILDVHKIHLLCSIYNGKKLLDYLKTLIKDSMLNDKKKYTKDNLKSIYSNQKNTDEITNFKMILNYFLDSKYKNQVISAIYKNFPIDITAREFYLTRDQIVEMENNDMIIGAHSMSHILMKKLDYNCQLSEIRESFEFLNKICKLKYKTYCHPFGGINSFNEDTISILMKESIDYSFSVESREINNSDHIKNIQSLPRFDCNEFLYGNIS